MCSEAPPQSGGGLVKAPPRLNVPHTQALHHPAQPLG